jgi:thiol-disulfide isomerase/thioredoxin
MSQRQDKERRRRERATQLEALVAAERRKNRIRLAAILGGIVAVAAIGVVVASSSGGGSSSAAPSAPVSAPAPAPPAPGSVPPQIAANIAQENKVIDASVQAKLASLHGVPVVVNQWAAWCPNCKFEFPFFQQLSQRYQKQIAFLGLDAQDDRGNAQNFLKRFPVNYPSVFDPDASESQSIGGGQGWPTTFYFDKGGHEVFVHQGAYATAAALDQDIHQYVLSNS